MLDGRGFGGKFFAEDCDCAARGIRPTISSHWSRNLDAEVPDPRRITGQNLSRWTGGIGCADFAGAKLERLMPPGAPQEAGFKMGRRVRHLDNDVSKNTGYERPNGSQRFRQPQHATRGACSRRPSCQGCGQHQFRSIRSSAAREFWLRCLFHSCRVF